MRLFDLPVELFEECIFQAVNIHSLARALKLRLVCKSFSTRIIYAIYQTKLIEEPYRDSKFKRCPLWVDYLVHRVLKERPGTHRALDRIREIAEKLALGDTCFGVINSSFNEYVRELCILAVKSSLELPWAFLVHTDKLLGGHYMGEFQLDYLTAAAAFNKPHVVKTLVTEESVNLGRSRLLGSPHEHAASNGNHEVLHILFTVPLQNNSILAYHAMTCAARKGRIDTVRYILESLGTRVTAHPHRDAHLALCTPSVEAFGVLKAWWDTTSSGEQLNNDVLHFLLVRAASNRWMDMVQHLISLGALVDGDIEKDRDVFRYVCRASHKSCTGIFRLLLDNGAQVGTHELLEAACHGNTEVVRLLLDHGIRSKDALAVAARRGYFGIVKLLVISGVDLDEGNFPPVVGAALAEHTDMVRYLVEHGATQHSSAAVAEISKNHPVLQRGFYKFW